MSINVFDLAQTDTTLERVSSKEYAGPCPLCKSTDSFHVQPHSRKYGSWMCRKCWNPSDIITLKGGQRKRGWGDNIAYLRHFRKMGYTEAKNYLTGKDDSPFERWEPSQAISERVELPDNPNLQERYMQYVRLAITRLGTPQGKPCLDYLLSRGLSEDTIKKARLGCIDSVTLKQEYLGRVEVDTQFIVIPWFADGILWSVNLRDIRPGMPKNERYRKFPKSGNGLYLAESLKRKLPTFLVEGEIDALSLAQEAGDLVNVVATGGTSGSLISTWIARLARVPTVMVSFDREAEAEERAATWLKILNQNAIRYAPQLKDVNKMLVEGGSVRRWVLAILDYLNEDASSQPFQETAVTHAQYTDTVKKVTDFLPDCTMTPIQPREQTGPTELEQAIMNKLQGYGLFLAKRCTCGSRLKWPMAGGMYIVCARCEPGGLWSYQAIEMLNRIE